ncbi:hypothetical protein [Curtobacterium sp. L1-20]|uniref:hypothetical protein n=1 Tax=Curtobacterium sp. L1-20 TaxID=3138181 RepID=UPI003B52A9D3
MGAAAAALIAGMSGIASPASAATTPGVNLDLSWTGTTNVYDKSPIKYTFTVTNTGRVSAKTTTLQWKYQEPVQPKAPTDGGYVNLRATAPKGAKCSVDTKKHIATCQLGALAPGATTKVTWTGTADMKGNLPRGLDGSYVMNVQSTPTDTATNNNSFTGGWGISEPR